MSILVSPELGCRRGELGSVGKARLKLIMVRNRSIGGGIEKDRKKGRGERREEGGRKEKKKEERKNERERENNEFFFFCSTFQNPILYFSQFFGMKFHFCVFFIMFTIFNKYDTKLNFQVNTLN